MKYRILESDDAGKLMIEVNKLMDEGYQPLGGLAAMSRLKELDGHLDGYIGYTVETFYQAMIRE